MLVEILIIPSACPGKPSSRRAFFSVGSHFKAWAVPQGEHWGAGNKPWTLTPPLDGLFWMGTTPSNPQFPLLLGTCNMYTYHYNSLHIISSQSSQNPSCFRCPGVCLAEGLDRSTRKDLPTCFEVSVPHCPAHTFWNFPQGWRSAGHWWW